MKSLFKSKRVFALVLVLIVTTLLAVPAASAANPPSGRVKVTNYAYSSYVMNVYTSGTPLSGDSVTLYTPSGSQSQSWFNQKISGTSYYRMEGYYQGNIALNYNQATTKCTVYTHSGNVALDYQLTYPNGSYANLIHLVGRSRNLGTSGNSNGAQLYWYTGSATIEENWKFSLW